MANYRLQTAGKILTEATRYEPEVAVERAPVRASSQGVGIQLTAVLTIAIGLLSVACAVVALSAGFSNYQLVGGTALLCGLAGWRVCPRNRRDSRATLLGVAALLGGVVALAGPIDTRMTRWTHPDLIDTRDSLYGRLTFTGRQGQVAAFENDAL